MAQQNEKKGGCLHLLVAVVLGGGVAGARIIGEAGQLFARFGDDAAGLATYADDVGRGFSYTGDIAPPAGAWNYADDAAAPMGALTYSDEGVPMMQVGDELMPIESLDDLYAARAALEDSTGGLNNADDILGDTATSGADFADMSRLVEDVSGLESINWREAAETTYDWVEYAYGVYDIYGSMTSDEDS